jgi:hypothetical protein
MITLLPAIKAVLEDLTQLPRKSDCYITPHANFMPTGTRQPCLGIKDAGMVPSELAGEMLDITARVDLIGFVKMTADGQAAICGDDGLYALLDAATDLLVKNRLGLADVQTVIIGPTRPSEMFSAENNQWLVKLTRTMIYTLERSSI